jgi:hypothetical protein
MAKPGEERRRGSLQVRGTVDVEKFKAARALGGDEVHFELRAMTPVRAGIEPGARVSCLVCIICIICIVCAADVAKEHGIPDLRPLPETAG